MNRAMRIASFLTPYKRRIAILLLMTLFSTALGLAYPLFIKELIDRVFSARGSTRALMLIVLLMFVVALARTLLSVLGGYLNTWLTARILFDMRFALFRKLQSMPLALYAKTRIGDLMARLNGDISEVQSVAMGTLLGAVGNVLTLAGSVAILVWLNAKLFLASAVLIPAAFLILRHFRGRIRELARIIRERNATLGHFLVESLEAAKFVRAHGLEKHEGRRFVRKNKTLITSMLDFQVASSLADGLNGIFLAFGSLVVLGYGGSMVIGGAMTLGSLIAFEVYQVRLFGPVQNLLGLYLQLQKVRASVDRVFEYLEIPGESPRADGKKRCGPLAGRIEFADITFAYGGGERVLDGLSFTIPEEGRYAIVGASGSGKTTIIELLLGFYRPLSGRILVDGTPVEEISLLALRRQISLLTQEPVLFHASIAENIAYGRKRASRKEIEEAARKAGIDALVRTLPSGYDTAIGDRGSQLSAGERQRIAIARAFLAEPRLLILDEATSALDSVSDRGVRDALAGLLRGRTTIVITHRLSMIDDVDMIFFLQGGRIVEKGSHEELMRKEGIYYRYVMEGFPREAARHRRGEVVLGNRELAP